MCVKERERDAGERGKAGAGVHLCTDRRTVIGDVLAQHEHGCDGDKLDDGRAREGGVARADPGVAALRLCNTHTQSGMESKAKVRRPGQTRHVMVYEGEARDVQQHGKTQKR